jgi:hypothetical protein
MSLQAGFAAAADDEPVLIFHPEMRRRIRYVRHDRNVRHERSYQF